MNKNWAYCIAYSKIPLTIRLFSIFPLILDYTISSLGTSTV